MDVDNEASVKELVVVEVGPLWITDTVGEDRNQGWRFEHTNHPCHNYQG